MKYVLTLLIAILSACGSTWDITRYDGQKFSQQQHDKDWFECEQFARLTYRGNPDAVWADAGRTDITISCMRSRGWNYKKTGTNLY